MTYFICKFNIFQHTWEALSFRSRSRVDNKTYVLYWCAAKYFIAILLLTILKDLNYCSIFLSIAH